MRTKRLSCLLSEEEKKLIIENAKKNRMSITQYIVKRCVVDVEKKK